MQSHKNCFVLMPFSVKPVDRPRYNDSNHWNEVYSGLIKPAVAQAGLTCEKDNADIGSRQIVHQILQKIEAADIVLCDISSHNPNVFLELGWALRADRPYFIIKDDLTEFTFDLGNQYTLEYDHRLRPTGLETAIGTLSEAIAKTLSDSDRRYSMVKTMSITMSFIEATNRDDAIGRLLLDVRQFLSELGKHSPDKQTIKVNFPWPQLVKKGMEHLHAANRLLIDSHNPHDTIKHFCEENNLVHNRNYQFSLLDMNNHFVYHDLFELIGQRAQHRSISGEEVFREVTNYENGAIAWMDEATSTLDHYNVPPTRTNICVFTSVNDSYKLLIEIHNEILSS